MKNAEADRVGRGLPDAPSVRFQTLGCKVNRYDTEAMADALWQAGFRPAVDGEEPDVVVVNTCAVTGRGESKSRQAVRKAARDFPEAAVVLAGCLPQLTGDKEVDLPVHGVVGITNRTAIVDAVQGALRQRRSAAGEVLPRSQPAPAFAPGEVFAEMPVESFAGRTRATVKIQEGCEQFCTYCIIPYARGPSRSRQPEKVVAELRRLVDKGFREVVLTGIHLGVYGRELVPSLNLAELLRRCLQVEGLDRIRLSSIEVTEVTGELIALMGATPRLCPHLHIPLQSGSDAILKDMNRPYRSGEFLEVIEAARAGIPDLAVTTDVIVGFPGEGRAEFGETVAFVERAGFSRLHVFPFSQRAGTPAAGFGRQVPPAERARRAAELTSAGRSLAVAFHQSLVGRTVQVLVEGGGDQAGENSGAGELPPDAPAAAEGFTGNYVRTVFPTEHPDHLANRVIPVLVDRAEHWGVWAHPIDTK